MSEASEHGRQREPNSQERAAPRCERTEWRSTGREEERTEWSGDELGGAIIFIAFFEG